MAHDIAKKAAGNAAAQLIQSGMLVGLGTGSTAYFFIETLIERCRNEKLHISAVATSQRSTDQAKAGGIPLCDISTITQLDITVDGADEIDNDKRMIKGGGGALTREKILASISTEMVVIIDEKKLVNKLGTFPLPVEVIPFAHELTRQRILHLGYQGAFRTMKDGSLFITDNGNFIIDIKFSQGCSSPENVYTQLRAIPGVLEIGFFFDLAGRVIVGYDNGHVTIIP